MPLKIVPFDEFKTLITKDKMDDLELEFMELTSNPSQYTKDVFIGKVLSIKDRQDNLVRDTLKSIPSKTVRVITYTTKIGNDEVSASVELVETKGVSSEEKTPFIAGDKIQMTHGETKSPIYTVTEDGKVELDGVISPASHIVGSFIESCGGKVTTIINGSGAKTYKINGLSHNKWQKV